MADLHQATIVPTKDQLIGPWLRTRPWWDGVEDRGPVGAFRLDDPAGEVGIECFLYGAATGTTLFVPVTYRGAPLPGGDPHLLGTMEHSVLGRRWVYDGCADPVLVSTVVTTIRTSGTQAELLLHRTDGSVQVREPAAHARGTGATALADHPPATTALEPVDEPDRTVVRAGGLTLTVVRQVGAALPAGPALLGGLAGGAEVTLATVS